MLNSTHSICLGKVMRLLPDTLYIFINQINTKFININSISFRLTSLRWCKRASWRNASHILGVSRRCIRWWFIRWRWSILIHSTLLSANIRNLVRYNTMRKHSRTNFYILLAVSKSRYAITHQDCM